MRARRASRRFDAQKSRRSLPEHPRTLGVTDAWRSQDMVDRLVVPWDRVVRSHQNLTYAHLGDQMPHRLRREHDRVIIELPQIFGRLLFQWHAGATLGEIPADGIGARGIGAEIAAAMGRADLEPWKAIEGTFEDQVR